MTFLKKILLVDQEPAVTALVRSALESTGRYVVKVEGDVRLAQHAAPWFRPDLVLLDGAKTSENENVNRQLKAEPSLSDTPFLFLRENAATDKKVMTGGFISGYSFLATTASLADLVCFVDAMLDPSSIFSTKTAGKADVRPA
jgi:DNA-binding response OmpR family regulator